MADFKARQETRLRFSAAYDKLRADIRARNAWAREQFESYQLSRLKQLVTHAAAHVPYYRDTFRSIGLKPNDIQSLQDLNNIPILEKEVLRERGKELVDERIDVKKLLVGTTSGTTGAPTRIYRTSREYSAAFAYNAERLWNNAGVERIVNRSVSIGGKRVADPRRNRPPFWVHIKHWNTLYMSAFHLADHNLAAYVDAIARFDPQYLEGYPSTIASLSRYIRRKGIDYLSVPAVFTTGEKLSSSDRYDIENAFKARVFDQYGCVEQTVNASECRCGKMHLNMDHSIVEVISAAGGNVYDGDVGELVGTSLERFAQPLIRYRTGDTGSVSASECACGSDRLVLNDLQGRMSDMLVAEHGRLISAVVVGSVLREIPGLRAGQIVQYSADRVELRLSVEGAVDENVCRRLLKERLRVCGDIDVRVVEQIDRTAAGKHRVVVNRMNTG